jgi:hypothetical protein
MWPLSNTYVTRCWLLATVSRCSRSKPTSSSSNQPLSSRSHPTRPSIHAWIGTDGVWSTADFSGNGDVTAEAVVVDFTEPTTQPSASTSGCEPEDYDGLDVQGKVVLLQRGTCEFGLKATIAASFGAIFNEGTIGVPDRNDVLLATLAGHDVTIPVIGTDYATGRSLVDLANGTGVTLHVQVQGIIKNTVTNNVIAETPGGRSDRTVVVGGHLDSVYTGPGINDDGSGVSMMLETAEQMQALGINPRNKVRFIFFSGEEQGLLGSDYYVSQLTKKQIQDISVMLDFDMLASPNYARFIYDGNGDEHGFAGPNGSGTIEQVFKDFWDSQGLAYETIPFDGRSDYDALPQPVSLQAASLRALKSSRSPIRSSCTAARPVSRSTAATTNSATTWATSTIRAYPSTLTPQFMRSSLSPRRNRR